MFIGLSMGLVNISNNTKWVSLSNQKCMNQPILINLHPNKYNQEFHYYLLAVKLVELITRNDLALIETLHFGVIDLVNTTTQEF